MNKEAIILDYCRGKRVLDIGCVEELVDFSPGKMRQTLHFRLRQQVPGLVGVDIEEAGILALNELGCDCHVSFAEDVRDLNLGLFDAIILGDIIEHVPDPCTLLLSLRDVLTDEGIVLCTTPNAMSYLNSVFLVLRKTITRRQHVAWYCRVTLKNTFGYAGYIENDFHFLDFHKTTKKLWRVWIEKPLFAFCPELSPLFCGVYSKNPDFSLAEKRSLQMKRIHL